MLIELLDGHVVSRMAERRGREPVCRQAGCQHLDKRTHLVRNLLPPQLGVARREQGPDDAPRARRPLDKPLVDVMSPRGCVVAPGRELEEQAKHGWLAYGLNVTVVTRILSSPSLLSSAINFGSGPVQAPPFFCPRRSATFGNLKPLTFLLAISSPFFSSNVHAVRSRIGRSMNARSL